MPNSDTLEKDDRSDVRRIALDTLYRAFNAGEPELLNGVLTADWQDAPLAPGQQPGRDGIKPVIAVFRQAFADLAFIPREVIISGDRAAVRLTLSGRHVGAWMGVAATGRTFEVAMHEMHHFDGDRVARTWHVEDWAGWREQVAGGTTAEE